MYRSLKQFRLSLAHGAVGEGFGSGVLQASPSLGAAPLSSFTDPLASLMNYEQKGVPKNAGSEGFTLEPTLELLKRLGNPHESLKTLHVAGSKGKGSVSTMIASVLQESGLKTGIYTSPHMHTIRERIKINGVQVSEPDYTELIQTHAGAIEDVRAKGFPLSHFEALTTLSFRYFADKGCDAVVVETGLGGIRDATNVLPPSAVQSAVITSIGMEHVEALGGSLRSISEAKAGISKSGRPVVIGRQDEPEALGVLRAVATARGASPIVYAPDLVRVEAVGIENESGWPSAISERVQISIGDGASSSSSTDLETKTFFLGPHQRDNIATAVATLRQLQSSSSFKIENEHIQRGIAGAYLSGRFQVLRRSKGGDQWVILDGAHTPASAKALVESIKAYAPTRRLAFVVACAADKDHLGIMRELRKARPNVIIFTSAAIAGAHMRSAGPGQLVGAWQVAAEGVRERPPLRCRELMAASVYSAVERAGRELSAFPGEPGVVCVTGSLHAVAEALKLDL